MFFPHNYPFKKRNFFYLKQKMIGRDFWDNFSKNFSEPENL